MTIDHLTETATMSLRVGAATDVGRVRDHNEDAALAEHSVFLVADGMGGHAAGEVASQMVIEAMREIASRDALTVDDLVAQLDLANTRIIDEAEAKPERRGMGTTATGLAVVNADGADHWAVFNVGDSRVYRFIDGQLTRVTVDHSEVQELTDAGVITEAEARVHPLRNVVTRSLGVTPTLEVDTWVFPPFPGERFVICSDGLTNEVGDDDIAWIVGQQDDPQQTAEELVRAAVEHGGRDNVTVIVVALDAVDEEDSETVPRTTFEPNTGE